MDPLVIQFTRDLEGVDYFIREDSYVVEVNGEPHVFDEAEEFRKEIIDLARDRGHIVVFDVELSADNATGSKLFDSYEDAQEFYEGVNTEDNGHYSWDQKQITAKILW